MYLVDLRRGKAPLYQLDRYALYISFFPQALAGPLVRWSEVMEQFGRKVYSPGWQRAFVLGIAFIIMGLFEKIVLGDRDARTIDPFYAQAEAGPLTNGNPVRGD
jgi:alginate O-acetyltransferase complex protein AlgI